MNQTVAPVYAAAAVTFNMRGTGAATTGFFLAAGKGKPRTGRIRVTWVSNHDGREANRRKGYGVTNATEVREARQQVHITKVTARSASEIP
jgi:hypothetical protein